MKKIIGTGRCLWDFSLSGEAVIFDDEVFPPLDECIGKILITHIPSPDIVIYMRTAKAIVAETGGVLCHAAVLALELGCPIIVAADGVKEKVGNGDLITVEGIDGVGTIYV
ncbi:MAG: PEP-utilizing enzyme [Candidatus Coproplasma sp.]